MSAETHAAAPAPDEAPRQIMAQVADPVRSEQRVITAARAVIAEWDAPEFEIDVFGAGVHALQQALREMDGGAR